MKRFAVLLAFCIAASLALSQAQDKAILSTFRVFPKPGKDADLKKALAAHAAKYHKGDWRWRVFLVVSGPDEGSYQINEGPASWTALEGRKDISDEHTRDYETTVLPLTEKALPNAYMRFQKDLSTDSAGGTFKKVLLRHYFPKPGKGVRFMNTVATWKQAWEKMGLKVTVWTSFYSGQPQIVTGFRLRQGWIELENIKPTMFREAFDQIAGVGAYDRYLEDLSQSIDHIDEDMMELLPEVSSAP
jgi:hypothetical protein